MPVTLTGNTTAGAAVNMQTTTDANGAYNFGSLAAGNYAISAGDSGRICAGPLTGSEPSVERLE